MPQYDLLFWSLSRNLNINETIFGLKGRDATIFGSKGRDATIFGLKGRDATIFRLKGRDATIFRLKGRDATTAEHVPEPLITLGVLLPILFLWILTMNRHRSIQGVGHTGSTDRHCS